MPSLDAQNLLWYDAVQIFALVVLFSIVVWVARRSISQGERVMTLEIKLDTQKETLDRIERLVTNHFSHRFEKIQSILQIESWDDEE